jgi:succinate dehydrogenase/fumarate reductase-like Fe-S protein
VWRCRTIFNCTEPCTREIRITEAIGEVKKAILKVAPAPSPIHHPKTSVG